MTNTTPQYQILNNDNSTGNYVLIRNGEHIAEFYEMGEAERVLNALMEQAELLEVVQKLVWEAYDHLYALKDSKCDYQESSEYITQLKDYIACAKTTINKAKGK